MKCTCGFDNTPGARFCASCGSALSSPYQERSAYTGPSSEAIRASGRGRPSRGLILGILAVVAIVALGCWWITRQPTRHVRDNSGLYLIVNDGEFGFIDRSGKTVIKQQFERAGRFSEGLATVRVGRKWGYIDKKGAVVIAPQFDEAGSFRDGLAAVALGKRWGYVNEQGSYVINAQFDEANQFSETRALISSSGRRGYIDPTGKIVINPQFDAGGDFSEGLAAVRVGDRWGYVNKSGEIVINPQFDAAGKFSERIARIAIQSRYGYIDRSGSYAITPQFDDAQDFSEGLAAVRTGGKWGYIARDGKYIVNPQFEHAESVVDDRGSVLLGQKRGYIDSSGKFAINPQYVLAESFVQGLALVRGENGREGYVDQSGKYVWQEEAVENEKPLTLTVARNELSPDTADYLSTGNVIAILESSWNYYLRTTIYLGPNYFGNTTTFGKHGHALHALALDSDYSTYRALAKKGLITLDELSVSDAPPAVFSTGARIERAATVALTKAGARMGAVDTSANTVTFTLGTYRVSGLLSNIPVDTDRGSYRIVQGTHVLEIRPWFAAAWAELGWPTHRDRRFRAVLKYDPAESKWGQRDASNDRYMHVDIGPYDGEFESAYVPATISQLQRKPR